METDRNPVTKALGSLLDMKSNLENALFSPELAHNIVSHLQETHREDLIPLIYENTRKLTTVTDEKDEMK